MTLPSCPCSGCHPRRVSVRRGVIKETWRPRQSCALRALQQRGILVNPGPVEWTPVRDYKNDGRSLNGGRLSLSSR